MLVPWGGGFHLNEDLTAQKLRYIVNQPQFKQVISTQTPTTQYLLNLGVPSTKITEIIGGCYLPDLMECRPVRNGERKRIVFCSNRYGNGYGKGFDLFVETAKELSWLADFIVIGGFSPNDTPGLPIHYLGSLSHKQLKYELTRASTIISPSRVEFNGNFDGFPNGSTITAAFCGAAMIVTDPMNQNKFFTNKENILICDYESLINELKLNWYRLEEIGLRGREVVREKYSYESQILPRIQLLESFM